MLRQWSAAKGESDDLATAAGATSYSADNANSTCGLALPSDVTPIRFIQFVQPAATGANPSTNQNAPADVRGRAFDLSTMGVDLTTSGKQHVPILTVQAGRRSVNWQHAGEHALRSR